MIDVGKNEELLNKARYFAALSSSFSPLAAIAATIPADQSNASLATWLLASLRSDCEDAPDKKNWTMRQASREDVLASEYIKDIPESFRKKLPKDEASKLIQSLYFTDSLDLEKRLNELLSSPSDHISELETTINAIASLGKSSELAGEKLPSLRSSLNHAKSVEEDNSRMSQGYYGNVDLREEIANLIDSPRSSKYAKVFYIDGLPGVGKSFLLTKVVQEARGRTNPIVITLDFDRRGLNLLDEDSIAMEISRQIADEEPNHARQLEQMRSQHSNQRSRGRKSSSTGLTAFAMLKAIGGMVQDSGRNVLLILDTLEVLRSYGKSHPKRLFSLLDQLIKFGFRPLTIIGAGRGHVLDTLGERRFIKREPLIGLPDLAARKVLEDMGTPADAIQSIVKSAKGNPLLLRLSSKLVVQDGSSEAVKANENNKPAVAGAYMYRAILSRIESPKLRNIANVGLALTQVNAQSIRDILAPALGETVSDIEAQDLVDELSTHYWLVAEDPGGQWVRHQRDIRKNFLPLLNESESESDVLGRVHKLAAKSYRESNPVLALYHQLHLVESGKPVPEVSSDLARRFSDQMIEELPNQAADALYIARGELSRTAQALWDEDTDFGEEIDPSFNSSKQTQRAIKDLEMLLERGDYVEAEYVYQNSLKATINSDTKGRAVVLSHLWLCGQWNLAKNIFDELRKATSSFTVLSSDFSLFNQVIFEMRAEFDFKALVNDISSNDEYCRLVQRSYRDSEKIRLHEGALAFALLSENRDYVISGGWRDVVGAAGTGLNDDSNRDYAKRDAMALQSSFGLNPDIENMPAHDIAALLNPYAKPIASLALTKRIPVLNSYLSKISASFEHMPEFSESLNRNGQLVDGGIVSNQVSDTDKQISFLRSAGLTADWLSAFDVFHSKPDIRLIARRAEIWRRVAAGSWEYGQPPPGRWKPPIDGIDFGTLDWFHELESGTDSAERAALQLLYWASPMTTRNILDHRVEMGVRSQSRLASILLVALRSRRSSTGTQAAYESLRAVLSKSIGRSIAVPIVVLASQYSRPQRVGPYQDKLMRAAGQKFSSILNGV